MGMSFVPGKHTLSIKRYTIQIIVGAHHHVVFQVPGRISRLILASSICGEVGTALSQEARQAHWRRSFGP